MTIVFVDDYDGFTGDHDADYGDEWDTPGAVGDDDLRAELADEARMYAWLERGEE